jgi:dynein heavy chain
MQKSKDINPLMSRTAPANLPIRPPEKNGANAEPNPLPLDMKLDHNNMVKSLKTKSGKVAIPRLVKTTKPPPIRAYPGEVTLPQKRILDAIYYEELDFQDVEKAVDIKSELTSEELMRHPEYLKIDQSKLPLEIFDNVELEAMDKTPDEWISSGSTAQTPYYHGGEWIWRPVAVKRYDDVTNEFEVHFLPNGIFKKVKRLNLQFDHEDAEKFHERRRLAEKARSEAKEILRLDFFVEQQPNHEIRIINKNSIKKIHARIVDGLPLSVPFPEPDTRIGRLLRRLTADIIRFYSRTMKRTVLHAKLSGPYKNELMILKCQQLRLPGLPAKPPVPRNGKVSCPEYSFKERVSRIEHLHYSSIKEVLNVYRWLHNKWIQTFQYYNFYDDKLTNLNLPCTLKEFKDIQSEKLDNTIKLMQRDFHRAFMDQFMDCVQDVFDFFQSNLQVFMNGALHKLFRVLDIKLGTFMRNILLSSLHTWQGIVNQHTDITEHEKLLTPPSAKVDPVFNEDGDEIMEETSSEPSYKARLIKRRTELNFPLNPKQSLFQVELVMSGNKIVLEPSLEDIQVCFIQLIDKMVVAMRSFTSIDKDTMSLLVLEPRTLFNIGAGDPLYADVDATVRKIKANVMDRLTKSMIVPTKLCKMYNEYIWLMADDVNDYLENVMATDPTPTSNDYALELQKLNKAMEELAELSFNHENFTLVKVSTDVVNNTLYNRARELRDGLAQIIMNECRQNNVAIIDQYNAILDRIAEKPANEKQLADLRDFIEASKATVNDLKKSVADNRNTLKLLEQYNISLPIEDMGLSWSTLEYPSKVEHSGKEVEIALEADKIRMMDRLALQKDQFEKVVENLGKEVKAGMKLDDYADKEKIVEKINGLMDSIHEAKRKGDDFNMREKVFGFAPTDYGILDKYEEELMPIYKLWNMISDFYNSKNDWLNGDFKELEGNKIEEVVTDWWKTSYKLAKSLEEELPGPASCALKLREDTTEFRKNMPVIQSLASKALKRRHWEALSELLGKNIDPEEDLTLQQLLDLDAAGHIESIQEVTIAAEKEYNLEKGLNAMMKEWETIEFEVKAYKESGTFVVGGIDDIVTLLDDHIVKTQTMRGSPYIKPIEKECKNWEHKLKYAQSMLDALIACQRTWMYLEPIFGSEDIMRQLPTEARRFQGVDTLWKKTMADANQDPNFMTLCDPEKRLEEKFKKANEKLEEITKGLNDYLEMKRLYFPRFFFLSNDELLEILSQTKEPRAVQPHLGKCFEGINKVKFESDLKISQIISAEGEAVKLDKTVDPESAANKGNVEKWLLEIESIQWESVRTLTVASLAEYPTIPRKRWILNWPAQVILGVSCVYWTTEVTIALKEGGGKALQDCNNQLDKQLKDMVALVRGKLSKLERKTLGALTTIDVHNRDVVSKMVELGTHEVSDFEWMSQLRYYWEDSWKDGQAVKKGMKTLVARIVNAKCLYGYEYLGNTMRLVITALTDRCYRTMIGALDLLYGGAPEGPAGTGKTETVKGEQYIPSYYLDWIS